MSLDERRLLKVLAQRELVERVEESKFAEVRQATARREQSVARNRQRRLELYTLGAPAAGDIGPREEQGRSAYTVRLGRELVASASALEAGRRQEESQRVQLLQRRTERMAIEALLRRLREARRMKQRRHAAYVADEWAARDWFSAQSKPEVSG